MKKVLHVFHHLNNGGTENVIKNIVFNLGNDFLFDFLVYDNGKNEKDFCINNNKIYKIITKSKFVYFFKMIKFLKENKYDIVHIHMCDMMYVSCLAAHVAGVKKIIIHSHSGLKEPSKFSIFFRLVYEFCFFRYANAYFGCSQIALDYIFPLKLKKSHIIFNGIDVNRYCFNENFRKKIKNEFLLSDNDIIIISIGRLEYEKNQMKIIDIAKKDHFINHKYFIVGSGSLYDKLNKEILDNSLENKVFLLGERNDIPDLLSASDLFLLPSIIEGLGIVLIEAQASGLQCIASDSVPLEADLKLGLFEQLDLESDWNNLINSKLSNDKIDRIRMNLLVRESNYDCNKVCSKIKEIYNS